MFLGGISSEMEDKIVSVRDFVDHLNIIGNNNTLFSNSVSYIKNNCEVKDCI
ncbi:ABC transporter ATP-binding protein [Borrelia miyamotoi FR64b]|nr:ABC transporter ATP-binding protein [Borrelia miyamotoi FR64b]